MLGECAMIKNKIFLLAVVSLLTVGAATFSVPAYAESDDWIVRNYERRVADMTDEEKLAFWNNLPQEQKLVIYNSLTDAEKQRSYNAYMHSETKGFLDSYLATIPKGKYATDGTDTEIEYGNSSKSKELRSNYQGGTATDQKLVMQNVLNQWAGLSDMQRKLILIRGRSEWSNLTTQEKKQFKTLVAVEKARTAN